MSFEGSDGKKFRQFNLILQNKDKSHKFLRDLWKIKAKIIKTVSSSSLFEKREIKKASTRKKKKKTPFIIGLKVWI